jgi:molybdopterin-dependent oxidoreductase alpha subunit
MKVEGTPRFSISNTDVYRPQVGGGWPVIGFWAKNTFSPQGLRLWQKLFHHHACKSCAWGTSGFTNELGQPLQRCMKGLEAERGDIQKGIDRHFFSRHPLKELQLLSSYQAERLGRFSYPVILREGSDRYEPIEWNELYSITQKAFSHPAPQLASYSSGRSSNEAAFTLQLMMRTLGSENLADCSDLCHVPSTRAFGKMFGTNTSVVELKDLHKADCFVMIGSNAPANSPRLMNELKDLRARGGRILIINPVVEVGLVKFASPAELKSLVFGSDIASFYVQPNPGSDAALFLGIQKWLIEHQRVDYRYLETHAIGWESVVEHARSLDWQTITELCGVSIDEIALAAKMIADAERVIFGWSMGLTQHANGVENVMTVVNTALMTGNVAKEGAGCMPIRGHSNVQGFGSMGVTTNLKEPIRQALEKLLGRSLSHTPGYNTRRLIRACEAGKVSSLLCLGGNLYAANPDREQARQALNQVETIIYLSTKPNIGHFHGLAARQTIIVPVLARDEQTFVTTVESGNNFVRHNQPGSTHLDRRYVLSEIEFLTNLADLVLGSEPINWRRMRDPEYIRQLIATVIPGYGQIASIGSSKKDFTIEGRILHSGVFPTPTGKASMFVTHLPDLHAPSSKVMDAPAPDHAAPFVLITARSYSQHNTVVYKQGDEYRAMPHRNCLMMHPQDAARSKLQEHDRVVVQGQAGKLSEVEVIFGDIKQGSILMFYPETNAIIRPEEDPQSDIPAFKRNPVLVYSTKKLAAV